MKAISPATVTSDDHAAATLTFTTALTKCTTATPTATFTTLGSSYYYSWCGLGESREQGESISLEKKRGRRFASDSVVVLLFFPILSCIEAITIFSRILACFLCTQYGCTCTQPCVMLLSTC